MNPRTKRACLYCGARDVWDRVRYLDECGEVTTYPAAKAYVESVVCLSCKEPQPLGPARDTGPHAAYIAVEMRAAELVQRWNASTIGDAKFVFSDIDDEEIRGWSMAETNMQEHTNAWHAGYLARVIATHKEGE